MMKSENLVAQYLLQSKAIKLEPTNPFTWASGWKSPIYCDNRKTLSFPEIRSYIKKEFVKLINEKFISANLIAGVATGAIAQGALVADAMELPFVYVRSSAKSHGLTNLIEGKIEKGQKAVVIEDLISTGGSSLKAVEALKEEDVEVLGMLAIFTYGFPVAADNFERAKCPLYTLCDYEILIEQALQSNYITGDKTDILRKWRKDPENWMKQ
jgi:orotate phosphoribosyltransferase